MSIIWRATPILPDDEMLVYVNDQLFKYGGKKYNSAHFKIKMESPVFIVSHIKVPEPEMVKFLDDEFPPEAFGGWDRLVGKNGHFLNRIREAMDRLLKQNREIRDLELSLYLGT